MASDVRHRDTPGPQPVKSGPRIGRLIGIVAAVMILLLALGTTWMLASASGAKRLFAIADNLSGGMVQSDGVSGRLNDTLHIQRLTINLESQKVVLDDVALRVRLAQLLQGRLHVPSLHIGKLGVISKMTQTEEAPSLPDSISLPLRLRLDRVQVDGGQIATGPLDVITLGTLAFNLDFDGERYLFDLDQFSARSQSDTQTIAGDVVGQATLSATKPYPLNAQLTLKMETTSGARHISANGKLTLQGSLAEMTADVNGKIGDAGLAGNAVLRPFHQQLLGKAELSVQDLDLAKFAAEMPTTAIRMQLKSAEDGNGVLVVNNAAAGLYNEGRAPLQRLLVDFSQRDDRFVFTRISTDLGSAQRPAGTVEGSGSLVNGALSMNLKTDALDLKKIDDRIHATRVAGALDIKHAEGKQDVTLAVRELTKTNPLTLDAHAVVADDTVKIDRAKLRSGASLVDLSADVGLAGDQAFALKGTLRSFNLQDFGNFSPVVVLNGDFSVQGERHPSLKANAAFDIKNSQIAGNAVSGKGEIQLRADTLLVSDFWLAAGSNRFAVNGTLAEKDSRIVFTVDAPALDQLGSGLGGSVKLSGEVIGSMMRPRIVASWTGSRLRAPGPTQVASTKGKADITLNRSTNAALLASVQIDAEAQGLHAASQQLKSLTARAQYAATSGAPLLVAIRGNGISGNQFSAQNFSVDVNGTTAQHVLNASLQESDQQWRVTTSGGLHDLERAPRWEGNIALLEAQGRLDARLIAPAALKVSQRQVQLDRFRLALGDGLIAIEQFVRGESGIQTRGRLEKIAVSELLRYVKPDAPLVTDLRLAGDWDFKLGDQIDGTINLKRESGDIAIRNNSSVKLGLSNLTIGGVATNGRVALNVAADGSQLGHIDATVNTVMGGGGGVDGSSRFSIASDSPLNGALRLNTPSLGWLGPLVSAALVTEGSLRGDVALSGTFGRPQFSGQIAADELRLLFTDTGVDLRNGTLRSAFRGDQLIISRLDFQNGGTLSITGPLSMVREQLAIELSVKSESYKLIDRSDRKLTVSGGAVVGWRDNSAKAEGKFTIDSGMFDIGSTEMPQLSDDVVIVGQTDKPGSQTAIALDLGISLGDGIRLQGRGLNAVLVGDMRLLSSKDSALRAEGNLRIASGTFKAYGQELAIEQGLLRFNGPLDNPALDILAMRRGQEVEAGVSVRGTVLAPRITLVSEPPVPDAEKLSWLVLGRSLSGAGEGDIGALQSAAGSLLTKGAAAGLQSQIATAFGLDDFSIGTGGANLQERIVTLGKKVSSRLYVSYKQGLESASSILLLRYTLTPRITVEAEAGTSSALSILYNFAFD